MKEIKEIQVDLIQPNPWNRKTFGEQKMQELIASIKEKGILSPLLIRPVGDKFQIIVGERRWRAAKAIGMEVVPAIVEEKTDIEAQVLTLIENIQREDISPIDEAESYKKLIEDCNLTQEQIGKQVGKVQGTISRSINLLLLPKEIQDNIRRGIISAAHGEVLLRFSEEQRLNAFKEVLRRTLSVRETEALLRKLEGKKIEKKKVEKKEKETSQVLIDGLPAGVELRQIHALEYELSFKFTCFVTDVVGILKQIVKRFEAERSKWVY